VQGCHPERSRGNPSWMVLLLSNYGTRIWNGDPAERAGSFFKGSASLKNATMAERLSRSLTP